jgi:CRP-like cAMP-binding protein
MTKVLLIEDNDEVRENTAEILELANYEVETAVNGKAGVDRAHNFSPDIIICDIMMPELDGYGVLHILGKNADTASIPFIFLTAKAEKADVRKGMMLGADDYLTKPFDETELLDAIEIRLKKVHLLRKDLPKDAAGLDEFFATVREMNNLAKLSENRKRRVYKKKNNIFLEGDVPIAIYYIISGKVKTYKTNREGKEYITGLHGPGDFVGYIDQLKGESYSESAMAMEDSDVSIIPKQDFLLLIYNNRDVSSQFIKILSDNITEMEEQLLHLAYNSVRQRVAEALLVLRKKAEDQNEDPNTLYISREDLANMVGTAPESVIRTLSDYKEEGIIEIKSSKILVLEPDRLGRVMQGYVR